MFVVATLRNKDVRVTITYDKQENVWPYTMRIEVTGGYDIALHMSQKEFDEMVAKFGEATWLKK